MLYPQRLEQCLAIHKRSTDNCYCMTASSEGWRHFLEHLNGHITLNGGSFDPWRPSVLDAALHSGEKRCRYLSFLWTTAERAGLKASKCLQHCPLYGPPVPAIWLWSPWARSKPPAPGNLARGRPRQRGGASPPMPIGLQ